MFGASTGFRVDQLKHNDAARSEVSSHSSSAMFSQQGNARDHFLTCDSYSYSVCERSHLRYMNLFWILNQFLRFRALEILDLKAQATGNQVY